MFALRYNIGYALLDQADASPTEWISVNARIGTTGVDGGVNPRKSGDDRKAGTRFAACDQPLLAIYRSDANGCPVALCQRRQPPKAGAVGKRLQRATEQSSSTINNDGWFRITQVRLTRERPYAKTVRFSERPHRRLLADSSRRQQPANDSTHQEHFRAYTRGQESYQVAARAGQGAMGW